MPGIASLKAQQYYAHPQNLFWKLIGEILGFDSAMPYEERVCVLQNHGIAVWDVLKHCVREGSLDSDIEADSAVPNDFASFFARHPAIHRICFNGNAAASLFKRHVLPTQCFDASMSFIALPSTSPANASIPRARKLQDWRAALDPGLDQRQSANR